MIQQKLHDSSISIHNRNLEWSASGRIWYVQRYLGRDQHLDHGHVAMPRRMVEGRVAHAVAHVGIAVVPLEQQAHHLDVPVLGREVQHCLAQLLRVQERALFMLGTRLMHVVSGHAVRGRPERRLWGTAVHLWPGVHVQRKGGLCTRAELDGLIKGSVVRHSQLHARWRSELWGRYRQGGMVT